MGLGSYGVDDYVACLAYAGPPPPWGDNKYKGRTTGSKGYYMALSLHVAYIDMVEEFCFYWFTGKAIDGQWAGFFKAYTDWALRNSNG